jgi:hypothetical protein
MKSRFVVGSAIVAASLFMAPDLALACRLGIGDRVWNDANRNGIQDAGESGINGVRVTITPGYYADRLDPNSLVTSAITQTGPGEFGDGYFMFRPVDCDVNYTIAVDLSTLPAGMVATGIGLGSDPAVDSDDPAGTDVLLPVTGFDYVNDTIDFGFFQPAPSVGTATPGYWKNHPEAWPVNSIVIGNVMYPKIVALGILHLPDGDKRVTMFRALLSAKLNVLNGAEGSCVADDIAAGDQWMITYGPVPRLVKANSAAWRMGEPIASRLDAYNNGLLCAPHRD